MKPLNKIMIASGMIIFYHMSGTIAWAANNPENLRGIYDVVMRWLNFLILTFVIVKYSRVPLKNFLRLQKEEVVLGITNLELKKKQAFERIEEIRNTLADSELYVETLKKRIIAQGEREKESRIQEAHRHSEIFLKNSKQKIHSMIVQAQKSFKAEMIDSAIDMAMAKLPEIINEEDNRKFFNQYLDGTQSIEKLSA